MPSRPTTPDLPVLRIPVWLRMVLAVVLLGVVVLLAFQVSRPAPPALDTAVWQFFVDHRQTWLTPVVIAWTWIGSTVAMTIWCVTLAALLSRRGDRRDAALVLGVGIGAALLVFGIKRLVGRSRPPLELRLALEDTPSFPSGHALAATAVLGVTVLLLPRLLPPRAVWPTTLVVLVFWLGIGASRLYLAVHWATDVLAGAALGSAWLLVAVSVHERVGAPRAVATAGDGAIQDHAIQDHADRDSADQERADQDRADEDRAVRDGADRDGQSPTQR